MLREHYPNDKQFEEVLGYVPELSPELKKVNSYLEDEKLYRLIRGTWPREEYYSCKQAFA